MIEVKLNNKNKDEYIKMYKDYIKELQVFNPKLTNATSNMALNRQSFNTEVLLFEEDAKIVGFAILGIELSSSFSGNDIFIQEFYVKEEFRRKGFGRNMMQIIMMKYPCKDFSAFILKNNKPAMMFWDSIFYYFDYSERTSAVKIQATGDKTVFKYWTKYYPF